MSNLNPVKLIGNNINSFVKKTKANNNNPKSKLFKQDQIQKIDIFSHGNNLKGVIRKFVHYILRTINVRSSTKPIMLKYIEGLYDFANNPEKNHNSINFGRIGHYTFGIQKNITNNTFTITQTIGFKETSETISNEEFKHMIGLILKSTVDELNYNHKINESEHFIKIKEHAFDYGALNTNKKEMINDANQKLGYKFPDRLDFTYDQYKKLENILNMQRFEILNGLTGQYDINNKITKDLKNFFVNALMTSNVWISLVGGFDKQPIEINSYDLSNPTDIAKRLVDAINDKTISIHSEKVDKLNMLLLKDEKNSFNDNQKILFYQAQHQFEHIINYSQQVFHGNLDTSIGNLLAGKFLSIVNKNKSSQEIREASINFVVSINQYNQEDIQKVRDVFLDRDYRL